MEKSDRTKDKKNTQRYFNSNAKEFDSLYDGVGFFQRYIDSIFRAGLFDRYRLAFENSGSIKGKRVLDLGCGSGRYSVEYAGRGAARVLGIDFSENMLTLARQRAVEKGVENTCEFVSGDFYKYDFKGEQFDIIIAMGVFDYIKYPENLLSIMLEHCRGVVIGSFPKISLFRMPFRKFRYYFKNCPVYFFTGTELRACVDKIGGRDYKIIPYKSSGLMLVVCK